MEVAAGSPGIEDGPGGGGSGELYVGEVEGQFGNVGDGGGGEGGIVVLVVGGVGEGAELGGRGGSGELEEKYPIKF